MARRNVALGAGVAGVTAAAAAWAGLVRPWCLRWGVTDDELAREWPGDSLAPGARTVSMRAVTIDAPASVVWRWLLQLGQDRAGFYSYTWLENLARADMPEVRTIVPEFQQRAVGDTVWMARPDRFGGQARMVVGHLIEGRAFILRTPDEGPTEGMPPAGSWGFLLEPLDATRTRLFARSRMGPHPTLLSRLAYFGFWEPAHFVMERRMLLTIKQLAEASAPGQPEPGQPSPVPAPERVPASV
jgi:hypothetical protein